MIELENPWIKSYPDDDLPYDYCTCPRCGEEASSFAVLDGDIIGCDNCIKFRDPIDFVD